MRNIIYLLLFSLLIACQSSRKENGNKQRSVHHATADEATSIIDYYPNGSIKEISEQGKLGPYGVETGIRYCFDAKGHLIKRIHFKYEWPGQTNELDILQIQEVSLYDTLGRMTKSYVLQSSYEGTPTLVGKVKKYHLN
jgi:hypothetical protein